MKKLSLSQNRLARNQRQPLAAFSRDLSGKNCRFNKPYTAAKKHVAQATRTRSTITRHAPGLMGHGPAGLKKGYEPNWRTSLHG